ncbi:MAG TPA: protein kinase, partial [Candidatus Dormibacteraeota bacterium]|nr:protein kinase [Candidatus Dormibacteraeota bacterium]
AKILDFGLAKPALTSGELSEMCTLPAWETLPGLLLGTPEYMSPEQVSGGRLDFRSDQFSFGLVLYEMVTGKRAFQRSTAAETLVAILREQAEPIATQNPDAPAPLCWTIERCLAKEPDKRYASTGDLARELAAIRDHLSEKPVRKVEPRLTNIPVPVTGFVGREKEVAVVKELLMRQDVRLITITGPGGIGKTRLAVEVEWPRREFSGWDSFCLALPGMRSEANHFRDRSDVGDPGGWKSVAARNTQEEFTLFLARTYVVPAG